eukprot:3668525-Pyramimonas_sp.AAC.1
MGVLLDRSWGFFGVGPSWGHLGRLGALLGCLGDLLDLLARSLGPSWPVLGPSSLWKSHAGQPKNARERPGNLRMCGSSL